MALNTVFAPWASATRRDLIERHGLRFDPQQNMIEDVPFTIAVCGHAKAAVYIPEDSYAYRVGTPTSLMQAPCNEQKMQSLVTGAQHMMALRNHFEDKEVKTLIRTRAASFAITALYQSATLLGSGPVRRILDLMHPTFPRLPLHGLNPRHKAFALIYNIHPNLAITVLK